MRLDRYVLAGLIALAAPAGLAQERGPGQEQAQRPPLPAPVTTRHELALPDRRLAYDATVEAYTLSDDAGKPLAEVSTISYRLADASAERPVTFFFNGGPGAASAFLNLGGLGPKVLATTEDGRPQGADGRLIDNPHSWLAWSDLVFVDPVGTGLSRPLGEDGKGFWSVEGDIRAAGAALRLWLTRQGRWPSPKYLVGESYGGFRAAKLAAHLYDEHGIGLAGLVLVSPVVDFATIARGDGTLLLPDALRLPSIAAVARRHGKGAENDDLEAVERFALGEYLTALAAPEPPDAVLARLARLTGLPEDSVRERRGRLSAGLVADELLEAEALAVSAYDGAVAGPAAPRRGSRVDPGFDPAVQAVAAAFNGL
ncbi:MAG TPA: hypothetical protein VEH84_18405, partial [Alphaproteobacteria bacterium]|nr:hypothetical protein [Alphaproteobacteria bacterium]